MMRVGNLTFVLFAAIVVPGSARSGSANSAQMGITAGVAKRLVLEHTLSTQLHGVVEGVLPDALHPAHWQPLAFLSNAEVAKLASGPRSFPAPPLELVQKSLKAVGGYKEMRKNLSNIFNSIYTINAEVGTPAQTKRLIVDTGSSDLWVDWPQGSNSSSMQVVKPGGEVMLKYGKGEVHGRKVEDQICLLNLCLQDQLMVSADAVIGVGPQVFDGLLGLAYPALSEVGGGTFLGHLLQDGTWQELAFGLQLRSTAEPEESFLVFGDFDTVMAEAPPGVDAGFTLPVVPMPDVMLITPEGAAGVLFEPMFWLLKSQMNLVIPLSDIEEIKIHAEFFAMLDSGTTFISVPPVLYNAVMAAIIPPSPMGCGMVMQLVVCPCDLPIRPLSFSFNDKDGNDLSVELGPKDLLQFIGVATYKGVEKKMCRLALQEGSPNSPLWILGDVFLRKVYVVHDVRGQQVVLFKGKEMPASGVSLEGMAPTAIAGFAALAGCAVLVTVLLRRARSSAVAREDEGAYAPL